MIKQLQDGNNAAAQEFYSLYGDYLAGVCSLYIDNEEDLKDVLQDALINIFCHIDDFEYRGAGSLQAWSKKVVISQSLKFLRKKMRHEQLKIAFDLDYDIEDDDDPSLNGIPPEAIKEMLTRLPIGYRTVFNLYVFENKSHQEIALLLGIEKSSSASQLHRAKKMLMKMIKSYNK